MTGMKRRSREDIEKEKQQREAQRQAACTQARPAAAHPSLESAVGQLARSLNEARRNNPCFKAWRLLRTDQYDRSNVLSEEAESVFQDLELESPNDPLIWHHLAIIRHGRAIEKHLTHQSCDQDLWSQGLQAWAKVIENQKFWDALRERWQSRLTRKPNDMLLPRLLKVDLGELRRQLPEQLLRLHYDLIIELLEAQNRSAAQGHFKLLSNAPFDETLIDSLKASLYRTVVGDTTTLCKQDQFAEARRRVENYLALEPNEIRALAASVRIACAECEVLLNSGNFVDAMAAIERAALHSQNSALNSAVRKPENALELKSLQEFCFLGSLAGIRVTAELGEKDSKQADDMCSASVKYCKMAFALGGDAKSFGDLCEDVIRRKLMSRDYSGALQFAERGKSFDPGNSDLDGLCDFCHKVVKRDPRALKVLEDILSNIG